MNKFMKNVLIGILYGTAVTVNRWVCTIVLLVGLTPLLFAGPVKSVRLMLPSKSSPVVENIGQVLVRQIQDRCETKVVMAGKKMFTVELAIQPDFASEGYRIEDRPGGGVKIVGSDERGMLYGVGKFLRTSRYDQGGFTPGTWRGFSAPKCPIRSVYLATHFNNFYESAPIEEVVQYIESLGLRGYNTILIHYPTWQYTGLSDPASLKWLNRFKEVLLRSRKIGLKVGLLQVPNDGYKETPERLLCTRVSPETFRGNNVIGLCPSNLEARELLLRTYGALLDEFSEIGLDYFVFWPYDEGGCGCKDCWPWGARGFVSISKDLATEVHVRYPACKFVVSTWCFEDENDANPDGEWVGLDRELASNKTWAEYLMADGHNDYFPKYILTEGVPGDLPLINFPEISMFGQSPWGGYGANPAPAHFEELWHRIKHMAAGGAPYSEGIYEDLNKAIIAGFYWNPDRKVEDIVREYVGLEFTPDAVDDLVEVVRIFEQNHSRGDIHESALRAFELVGKTEALMTPQARASWRWRIFYLRALIDKELFQRKGKLEGETLKKAYKELADIYHAQQTGVNAQFE